MSSEDELDAIAARIASLDNASQSRAAVALVAETLGLLVKESCVSPGELRDILIKVMPELKL